MMLSNGKVAPTDKLTDSEIVNCKNCIHKIICIFHNDSGTSAKKCVDFIDKDLINRLQAENTELVNIFDKLKIELQAMRNAANGIKKELFEKNEQLKRL